MRGFVLLRVFAEAMTGKRDALQDEPDALARDGRAAFETIVAHGLRGVSEIERALGQVASDGRVDERVLFGRQARRAGHLTNATDEIGERGRQAVEFVGRGRVRSVGRGWRRMTRRI